MREEGPKGSLRTFSSIFTHLGGSKIEVTDYLCYLVCRATAWITLTASDAQKLLSRKVSFSYTGSVVVSGFAFVCFVFF